MINYGFKVFSIDLLLNRRTAGSCGESHVIVGDGILTDLWHGLAFANPRADKRLL